MNLLVLGLLLNLEFSVGGLIWYVVLNLIVKVVMLLFMLFVNVFGGGGGEDFGYVEFVLGLYVLIDM